MDSFVGEVMDRKGWFVHTIAPQATVFEAIDRMVDLNVGALVILGGDGTPAGIVTERDYMRKVALQGRSSRATMVAEIMTNRVVVIEPGFTMRQCLYLMTQKRCRHLPVIRGGRAEGLISIGDCAREIAHDYDYTVQYLVDFIQRRYPV